MVEMLNTYLELGTFFLSFFLPSPPVSEMIFLNAFGASHNLQVNTCLILPLWSLGCASVASWFSRASSHALLQRSSSFERRR